MQEVELNLDSIIDKLDLVFSSIKEKHDEALKNLPELLSIQKKKFLIAINKTSLESFSEQDDELLKMVKKELLGGWLHAFSYPNFSSHQWQGDSKAIADVGETLQKHAVFKLSKYLDCAKTVFLAYSSGYECVYSAMEYVLTHSRQLGDQTKYIFENGRERLPNEEIDAATTTLPSLPDSKIMNRVSQLIEDLRERYDETKYRALNANATYFALLVLRRIVKKEAEFAASLKRIQTHDSYVKLCPWPLGNQLPKSNTSKIVGQQLIDSARLAIHAYLNTEDEITKRALRTTCVQYMEWNGLQLPNLFFKVVDLYGIEPGILWDCLCFEGTEMALINLGQDYYSQYKLSMENLSNQRWFPYCRVLNGNYHRDLSAANKNKKLCVILACLVDLKIGFDRSTIRLSHWVTSSPQHELKGCAAKARQLYETLNNIDNINRSDEDFVNTSD